MSRTIRSPGHLALIDALIAARREAGLTQIQLAAILSVHQSMIARIKSGQRRVDVPELIILCRAIGVDPLRITEQVAQAVPGDARL